MHKTIKLVNNKWHLAANKWLCRSLVLQLIDKNCVNSLKLTGERKKVSRSFHAIETRWYWFFWHERYCQLALLLMRAHDHSFTNKSKHPTLTTTIYAAKRGFFLSTSEPIGGFAWTNQNSIDFVYDVCMKCYLHFSIVPVVYNRLFYNGIIICTTNEKWTLSTQNTNHIHNGW